MFLYKHHTACVCSVLCFHTLQAVAVGVGVVMAVAVGVAMAVGVGGVGVDY